MFGWFKKDRTREQAHELLRHSRHFRRMREDVLAPGLVRELYALEQGLAARLGEGRRAAAGTVAAAAGQLQEWLVHHMPVRSHAGLREHLEILVVAIGVAMACRTYFIQPFKIPTGSMQPTLYGIQYVAQAGPSLMDRFPLKIAKWLVFGEWYLEIRTKSSGYVELPYEMRDAVVVGNRRYRLPPEALVRLERGQFLPKGTVLWRGVRVAGDHVFVDRVRWNLRTPRRGQIMVFSTDGIGGLPPKQHYIKRMVGLPGEEVAIRPPDLLIDGEPETATPGIRRVAAREPGYAGYQLVDYRTAEPNTWAMFRPEDSLRLKSDEYFALGDNTLNSRDGRYWGAVPRTSLVGPAVVVYWPLSKRWGLAR